MIIYPVFQDTQKTERILSLEKRISSLERRSSVDDGKSALAQRIEHLETEANDMRGRLMQQDKKLSECLERIPAAQMPEETDKPAKTASKKISEPTEPRYHEVKAGETLFRISRQYGVRLDDLRQFNGLSENALIHPGQKLLVSPP